ncbi:SH3 domain-containing protein [Chelativorans sp. ZYF759]|uniref:SH3 domain-containing protein n=1 Tax=Chelativorans sp. ZYF759 TaxID=2692213 RepID=UPI00145F2FFF|nr:SH3 domain-containing protein [Chelativorans sp. ZYF759]NMG40210.1 SH3 domain-containing protein [Chelativorans sp. ZYF759]
MTIKTIGILATLGLLSLPGIAVAGQLAYATHNVNVRAGPGVDYPVVDIARAGEEIYVYGCLSQRAWCDVDFDGLRGWMSSNYLAFVERGRRYVGPDAMYRMGTPIITFRFGDYWDRHYSRRDFYRDRHRWERPHGRPGPSHVRPTERPRQPEIRVPDRSDRGPATRPSEQNRQPEFRAPDHWERGWRGQSRFDGRERDERRYRD